MIPDKIYIERNNKMEECAIINFSLKQHNKTDIEYNKIGNLQEQA